MKKILFCWFLFAGIFSVNAQTNYFYDSEGNEVHFKIRKDMILIKAAENVPAEDIVKNSLFTRASATHKQFVIAAIDTLKTGIENLQKDLLLKNSTYMLEYTDGTLMSPMDKIFVKCKEGQTIEQVLDQAKISHTVSFVSVFNKNHHIYLLTVSADLYNVMDIVVTLYKSGLCEFAEPSFLRLLKPANANPYYPDQWGFKNTGQHSGEAGCDINVEPAWEITKGSSNIKVAIIDEGVDLTHPDLYANLLPGYDATDAGCGGSGGGPCVDDAHGTCCAGIVAAIDNTIGVVGVASSCKIIPVRIAYSDSWGYWVTTDAEIADGLHYAWNNAGADILSNSWGGGSPSAAINTEIQDALAYGRNGKGCVIVFASGNYDTNISYPANSNSNIIAVGAISPCCERKSPTSCDGESWWGSNYGTQLDVVAPGVFVPTTDIHGSEGYSSGDYILNFNGTSSACPHVAGVAALMLSTNPSLTQVQVQQIIESTAQKVRPDLYTYSTTSDHPSGTWNNEMGYGLVDAYAAVQAAAPCSTTVNFTNQTVTTNTTVTSDCNIYVQDVTVTNGAKLTLDAAGEVTIGSHFEVELGSEFEIIK
jgi:subtilisin family serine protease